MLCVARNNGTVTVYRPLSVEPVACAVLDDLPAASVKNIRCMVSDGDCSVWIGTLNAVVVLDLKTLARRNVPLRGSSSSAAVVAMCVADERCYCATRDGLIHVLQMQTCAPLFVVSTGSVTYSMTLVRSAHLWCGNAGGFTVYDITQPTAQPLKFLTPKAKVRIDAVSLFRNACYSSNLSCDRTRFALRSIAVAKCGSRLTAGCHCGSIATHIIMCSAS